MTKRVQASHHAVRPNLPNASNRTRDEVFDPGRKLDLIYPESTDRAPPRTTESAKC